MARPFVFERKHEALLPHHKFLKRVMSSVLLAGALLSVTIGVGTIGYHFLEGQAWIDALLNSVMMMSGLGLEGHLATFGGKIFTVIYVLFSAFIFYSSLALLFTPPLHRLLHHFHMDPEEKSVKSRKT